MKENDELFIRCSCGSEILVTELIFGDEEMACEIEFSLAIYELGTHQQRNIWRRIKYALGYIWNGKIYKDNICLTREDALKVATFIWNTNKKYSLKSDK